MNEAQRRAHQWRLRNAVHRYVRGTLKGVTLAGRARDLTDESSRIEYEEELYQRVCAIQDILEADNPSYELALSETAQAHLPVRTPLFGRVLRAVQQGARNASGRLDGAGR